MGLKVAWRGVANSCVPRSQSCERLRIREQCSRECEHSTFVENSENVRHIERTRNRDQKVKPAEHGPPEKRWLKSALHGRHKQLIASVAKALRL